MNRSRFLALLPALALGCITGHGHRPAAEVKAASESLKIGMSSAQVVDLLGSPDDARTEVCSHTLSQKCIVWRYSTDSYLKQLQVYFQPSGEPNPYTVVYWVY
ncbi:MAG TPA: hypothetical protein VMT17_09120 [Anaeromyxobacteraceae bacterium]|nr:hypothetical protein [Anaeromyxobacteraceae bacterium]